MNYAEIGQRIKKYRKQKNLSQEQLAEKVNISPTHMSHIETGATKLSLQVLVDLAQALDTSTDSLLFEPTVMSRQALADAVMKSDERQIAFLEKVFEGMQYFL